MGDRLRFVRASGAADHQSFCAAVDEGLSDPNRHLPTRFLYDERGSELFEQITELPEYYLTGCEAQIFVRYASEIAAALSHGTTLVEFGSGSSRKTRLLIEAFLKRQGALRYDPIDISEAFLRANAELLLHEYPGLSIEAVAGEYFDVAAALPATPPRLILFLGSNIGNLERLEAVRFLSLLSGQMDESDFLLVGIDLVKDEHVIWRAYNDEQGVTAEFNRNLLHRINRELDGHFNVDAWEHEARFDPTEQRVELRLISMCEQEVQIEAIGTSYRFVQGESIHTEWSHKYTIESFKGLAARSGLEIDQVWFDDRQWFASVLLKRSE